jgi:polysaccharide pyruvyl transferase WcaK-like protein
LLKFIKKVFCFFGTGLGKTLEKNTKKFLWVQKRVVCLRPPKTAELLEARVHEDVVLGFEKKLSKKTEKHLWNGKRVLYLHPLNEETRLAETEKSS